MKQLKVLIKRYQFFIAMLIVNVFILGLYPKIGIRSFQITWNNVIEMLAVIPPIFILLGLLDVWIEKETMMKYMGENSRFLGILIAFLLGAVAAGPLYAAFPVAGVLLKKGCKLSNVFIFIGAWSTAKIPLLLFEASSLGIKFTLIRLGINIIGILVIALMTEKLLSDMDKESIYKASSD